MINDKKWCLMLSCFLLTALPGAASVTSVTFTEAPGSPFTENLTETITSPTEAAVSGLVSCNSQSACTGELGTVVVGLDLTSPTLVGGEITGTLSGTATSAGDSLNLAFPISKTYDFTIDPGPFDKTLFTLDFPPTGNFDAIATIDLSLAAGQSVDLPLIFTAAPLAAVPEPNGVFLLGGLLAALPLIRKARMKFTSTSSQ